MIKAVSFDFWFTIVSIDKELDQKVNEVRKAGLEKLFSLYGIPIEPDDIIPKMLQAKRNIINMKKDKGFIDFSSRHIQIPYLLEFMSREMPTYLTRSKPILKEKLLDEFSEIITQALLKFKPPMISAVDDAVRYVKEQNLKIGIVSNTGLTKGKSLRKILEHYNILHHFDSILFSDEVELMKPNPKMFKILADQLKLEPSEIVHVGDTIYADIVGARKAGLHEGIVFLGAFDDQYQYRNLENDFEEFKPRYIIDDYRDFPDVMEAISGGKSTFRKVRNPAIRKRLKME
ncbi:MAG: HAD family hydrolase [Promethearchaeota archaeon]